MCRVNCVLCVIEINYNNVIGINRDNMGDLPGDEASMEKLPASTGENGAGKGRGIYNYG